MRFGARCRGRCGRLGLEGGAPGAGFGVLPFWVGGKWDCDDDDGECLMYGWKGLQGVYLY